MFEEKVTATQFQDFSQLMGEQNRELTDAIMRLQDGQDTINRRLDRYSVRLTRIINDLANFQGVVDHNALQSQRDQAKISELLQRTVELKDAIELVAANQGVKIDVLDEVPPTITVQPGLPERLGLTKLTKKEQREALSDELPAPIQLGAGLGSSRLQLVP